jgi:hypothetical protein
MDDEAKHGSHRCWTTRRDEKQRRFQLVSSWTKAACYERKARRIALEGDNQNQADC